METQAMIATALCFGFGLILVIQGVDTRGKRDQVSGPSENTPLNDGLVKLGNSIATPAKAAKQKDEEDKPNKDIKKALKAGDWPLLIGIELILLGFYQLNFMVTLCVVIVLTILSTGLFAYMISHHIRKKKFVRKTFKIKNKYQDLSTDEYSWLVFFLPQCAAFCGQAYTVWTGREAINGGQDLILAIFGVFFVPMVFLDSGLPSGLSKKGQEEGWVIFSFWGAVLRGQEFKKPKDAFFRMCADVFINFVYPTFLFYTFPIFVATSTSYMDAISKATGVFFAVKWDAESEKIELKPAESDSKKYSKQEPNRSEA